MVTLSATVWIRHILACIGNGKAPLTCFYHGFLGTRREYIPDDLRCFGCYSKPTTIIAVDKPTKGLRIQGQVVKQPTLSDGFWSSSTFDLDHSSLQYQRSYSSISTSALNLGSALDSLTSVPEFVNHGLNLWNESRLQWIGSGRSETRTKQKRARALSWNSTYESVLSRKTPFSRPVPLSEMIEFLVEAWDQDGLYD